LIQQNVPNIGGPLSNCTLLLKLWKRVPYSQMFAMTFWGIH